MKKADPQELCYVRSMKIHFLSFILAAAIISNSMSPAQASSEAISKNHRYCDDITQIDKLLDRSRETPERFASEKLKVERIVVSKDRRQLYLISDGVLMRSYTVAFGDYLGHKQFEGDWRTPEGLYTISAKNPKSQYNKALKISYPNAEDRAYAKSKGRSPGGQIMIHGFPVDPIKRLGVAAIHPVDWTLGCIAVTDEEIEEIYKLVQENTLIEICKVSVFTYKNQPLP